MAIPYHSPSEAQKRRENLYKWQCDIGFQPGLGLAPDYKLGDIQRVSLRAWLTTMGVKPSRVQGASDSTLLLAYSNKKYLAKMVEGKPSSTTAPALDLDQIESDGLVIDWITKLDSIPPGVPDHSPQPNTAQPAPLTATVEALTKAADQVLGKKLDQTVDKLQSTVDNQLKSALSVVEKQTKTLIEDGWQKLKQSNLDEIQAQINARLKPVERIIVLNTKTNISTPLTEHTHPEFPTLLTALSCGLHVMLVGGASSGKTTAAKNAAKILGLDFEITGAVNSEFKLSGYEDGNGVYHATSVRRAVEHGKLLLLDEWNRSVPAAQMFMQAGLANSTWPFPDRTIDSHPNFLCVAADNTFGTGQDRQYVSANQQDAAALDRWVFIKWEIDQDLEAKLFGDGQAIPNSDPVQSAGVPDHSPHTLQPAMSCGDWVRRVQRIRQTITDLGERHLVTMRASDFGGRLLTAGLSLEKVEQMTVWKGLPEQTIMKIRHHAKLEKTP